MKCKSACIPLIWICEGLRGVLLFLLSVCLHSPHRECRFLMRKTWYSPGLVAASPCVHLWGNAVKKLNRNTLNTTAAAATAASGAPLPSYVFLNLWFFCASEAITLTIAAAQNWSSEERAMKMKMKRRGCNGEEEEEVGEVEVASAQKRAVKKTSGFEMQLHISLFSVRLCKSSVTHFCLPLPMSILAFFFCCFFFNLFICFVLLCCGSLI